MATITGMTSAAMDAIAAGVIVGATVNGSGDLILTKNDSSTINAGHVVGATGATGANGTDGADGTTLSLDALTTANPTAANWSNNSHKITAVTGGSASGEVATYDQIMPKAGGTFTGRTVPAVFSLTYGTTVAVDASLGNYARLTLTASTATLGAPSNAVDGQPLIVEISQDGTGSRTMAWNSAWQFSTLFPSPTLSTAASSIDLVAFIYNSTKAKWICVGNAIGVA